MMFRLKSCASALLLGGLLAAGPANALSLLVDRASPIEFAITDKQPLVEPHSNAEQKPPADTVESKSEPGVPPQSGSDDEFKELEKTFPATPWPKN